VSDTNSNYNPWGGSELPCGHSVDHMVACCGICPSTASKDAEIAALKSERDELAGKLQLLLAEQSQIASKLAAAERERDEARRFPIQRGPSILWSVIAPHEDQARRNHGQTLARLAERGGLDPIEALAVIEDRDYPARADASMLDAHRAKFAALVERTDAARSALMSRALAAEAAAEKLRAEVADLREVNGVQSRTMAGLVEEVERLTGRVDESSRLHGVISVLEADNKRLRGALEPFADYDASASMAARAYLTVAGLDERDFRRAAQALAPDGNARGGA